MKKFGEPLTAQREQHYPRLLGQLAWSAMCLTWIRTWILWWQISLKEKGRESFSTQNHDLSDVGWNIFAHESMNDLPTIFASWPNFASACLYNLTWHLQHCFFQLKIWLNFRWFEPLPSNLHFLYRRTSFSKLLTTISRTPPFFGVDDLHHYTTMTLHPSSVSLFQGAVGGSRR